MVELKVGSRVACHQVVIVKLRSYIKFNVCTSPVFPSFEDFLKPGVLTFTFFQVTLGSV